MDMPLNNKKILFLGVGFYDYESSIKDAISKLGADVGYFRDCEITQLDLNIDRFLKNHSKRKIDKYNATLLDELSDNYDFVFVIKGEKFDTHFFSKLKEKNSSATFLLYQWDSIARVANYHEIEPFFDRVFSFDRIDCQNNDNLLFQPLFYRKLGTVEPLECEYDLFFVGVYFQDRYEFLKKVLKSAQENGLKCFFYLQTKNTFIIKKRLFSSETPDELAILGSKPIPYQEYLEKMNLSKAVIDINHSEQTGLTMRSIEVLAQNKVLITTNKDIISYNLDDSTYVTIDREKPFLDTSMVEKITNINNQLRSKMSGYSLDEWIKSVFNCNESVIRYLK